MDVVADEDTQRFRALTESWTAAAQARDVAALERVLADDFIFTSSLSSGGLQSRPQYVAFVMNVLSIESFRFSDFRVRRWGTTAIVHARYHQVASVLGESWSAEFLLTDVWIEIDGEWRAVTRHSSQPVTDGFVVEP